MWHNARKFIRVTKYLLAGVTVFCVSWIACVNEWRNSVQWGDVVVNRADQIAGPTIRTIVAYSESKQAEMNRPSPVTCQRMPVFPEIIQINKSWSPSAVYDHDAAWQRVRGRRISLYEAFFDDRSPQGFIRILATFHGINITKEEPLYCQIRSPNNYDETVEIVTAKSLEIWYHEWDKTGSGIETPLLLTCPLTEVFLDSAVVSIVTEPCEDPSNAFKIQTVNSKREIKRNFTICVKDMTFDKDISQNLIEWVEINKILGVEKIDVYIDKVSKETENILEHYRQEGYIRIFNAPIKNKPERMLWQRRKDHIITYNDCLYRNIKESHFIVPLDVDEVIVPKIANTLTGLVTRLSRQGWNSTQTPAILIQNVFFFNVMQNLKTNEHYDLNLNISKLYMKRDDVRIINQTGYRIETQFSNYLDERDDSNDRILEQQTKERYLIRCGHEMRVPKLVRHILRSAVVSPVGSYSKSLMVTSKVLTAFNHYPLASLGAVGFAGISAPFSEVQLNHYKESCNTTVMTDCPWYERRARIDLTALRMRNQLYRALAFRAPCYVT